MRVIPNGRRRRYGPSNKFLVRGRFSVVTIPSVVSRPVHFLQRSNRSLLTNGSSVAVFVAEEGASMIARCSGSQSPPSLILSSDLMGGTDVRRPARLNGRVDPLLSEESSQGR